MVSDGGHGPPHLLPPVVLTIVALTSLNLAIAYLLARSAGLRGIELPAAILGLLFVVGLLAAVAAVWGWRRYVADARAARARSAPPG